MFLACSCNNDYSRGVGCNVNTGQCECLPGVVGEKCNACPYRWVLVPDQGCHECDICHHSLLDVTDAMANELNPVINDFETVAGGYFTSQKLNYLDNLADKIEPEVNVLDPNSVNLKPLVNSIDALESEAKNFERKLRYTNDSINNLLAAGSLLLTDSRTVLGGTRKTLENIQNTVYEIQKLADSFDTSGSTMKADNAIYEAKHILKQLKEIKVDIVPPTEKQLQQAIDNYEMIENFITPVKQQNDKLIQLTGNISVFNDKLNDIRKHGNDAIGISWDANNLYSKYKDATVNSKLDTVNNHTKETEKNIAGTIQLRADGQHVLGGIFELLKSLENVNAQLKTFNSQAEDEIPKKENELNGLDDIISKAANHRSILADTVSEMFTCGL